MNSVWQVHRTAALPMPLPRDVDWPSLVAVCERRGIPVLRMDHRGRQHLIRTIQQLNDEWE